MKRNSTWRIPEKRIGENSTLGLWYDWILASVNQIPGLKTGLARSILKYLTEDYIEKSADGKWGGPTKPHKVSWERNKDNKYHMLTRIPHWFRGKTDSKIVKKGNRFLAIQEKRIKKAMDNKDLDKATIIWMMVLKLSKTYHIALFNKVYPKWYWNMSMDIALLNIKKFSNKCRRMNLNFNMNRWYLDKDTKEMATSDSKRVRPIGAPELTSRVMCKAINQMVYWLSETTRNKEMQHGYRVDKGCFSALMKIREGLMLGYKCYEFDLAGFFNTVPRDEIKKAVSKYCGKLCSKIVDKILIEIRYNFGDLLPERELRLFGMKIHGGKEKKVLIRSGIPQGLPLSPVISTMVLENNGCPKGLTMYADDGVYLYKDDMYEFTSWLRGLNRKGIRLSEEKSGETGNEFKFLGVYFNKRTQECGFEDEDKRMHWIKWEDERILEWFKKVAQWYGKDNREWDWDIQVDSMITRQPVTMNWWERTISFWTSHIFNSNPFRGYRWLYGYVDINMQHVRWDKLPTELRKKIVEKYYNSDSEYGREIFKTAGQTLKMNELGWIAGDWYDIASGSSWSCMKLLEYLRQTKLKKVKPFNFEDVERILEPTNLSQYDPEMAKGTHKTPRFEIPYVNGIMNYKNGYYEIINNGYDDKVSIRYYRRTKIRRRELEFIKRTRS